MRSVGPIILLMLVVWGIILDSMLLMGIAILWLGTSLYCITFLYGKAFQKVSRHLTLLRARHDRES